MTGNGTFRYNRTVLFVEQFVITSFAMMRVSKNDKGGVEVFKMKKI